MYKNYRVFALTLCIIMLCIMFVPITVSAASEAPSVGDGTTTPYEISTPGNLVWIMESNTRWDKDYLLIADINMAGETSSSIGTLGTKFTGSFDGNNHTISNLTINTPDYFRVGLFGFTDGATLQNITLTNCSINGKGTAGGLVGEACNTTITNCHTSGNVAITYEWVGGLVGYNDGGQITNCSSSCTVKAEKLDMPDGTFKPQVVGGFCGTNTGTIQNCSASGDVSARGYDGVNNYGRHVGGFVAYNGLSSAGNEGTITNCHATGDVTAQMAIAGGFVAQNGYGSTISDSYATGNATANGTTTTFDASVGGFVGLIQHANSSITKCYSEGSATSTDANGFKVGGFIGYVHSNATNAQIIECYATGNAESGGNDAGGFAGRLDTPANVENCYATGDASAFWFGGGFVGRSYATISKCYSTGKPSITGGNIGGFAGRMMSGSITDCYYDSTTSLQSDSDNAAPRTTAQMQIQATYAGWDFSSTWHVYDGRYPQLQTFLSDTTAPTVSSLTPADDAASADPSANLVIVFSENVTAETGNITIFNAGGSVEVIDVTGTKVSGNGTSTITINPDTTLNSLTNYYIRIDATAFNDLAGNSYAGISDNTTWNFTTGDTAEPSVVTLTPADNSTGLDIDSDLVIEFDETVNMGSGNITIHLLSNDTIVDTLDVTGVQVTGWGTSELTIDTNITLDESTAYYVNIPNTAVDDTSGNDYAGIADDSTWNFTTGEFTAPVISTLSPVDNAQNVVIDSNISITFNENVNVGSGNFTIYTASDDSLFESIDIQSSRVTGSGTDTITVDPNTNFDSLTEYYVLMDTTAIDDLSGNSFAGITTPGDWNFKSIIVPIAPSVGNGTSIPYEIATVNNLLWLMQNNSEWDKDYIQIANLNMTGITCNPIGTSGTKFTGTYNGQNFEISNFAINESGSNYVGLFGYIDGASLSNLTLTNVSITGLAVTGGLVGQNDDGSIMNCHISGSVMVSYEIVGGLIGYNKGGSITGSSSSCSVSAVNNSMPSSSSPPRIVGGFVGINAYGGSIENSHATGNVCAEGSNGSTAYGDNVGGFCADNGMIGIVQPGTITDCYATGTVIANRSTVGGFVARVRNSSDITGCYATGDVTANGINGSAFAGGFVAITQVQDASLTPAVISDCYATGNVITAVGSYAGGFVGRNQDGTKISKCYATGDASSGKNASGGFAGGNTGTAIIENCFSLGNATSALGYSGGFIGYNESSISDSYSIGTPSITTDHIGGFMAIGSGTISDCYYDSLLSGQSDNDGRGTPKNTSEMQSSDTFVSWDFATTWHVYDNQYPIFKTNLSDTTNPVVKSLKPADNATGIDISSDLTIIFSETVNVESGNITIYDDSGIVETIDITGGKVTGDGTDTITINPDTTLDSLTQYYVLIDATAFNDTSDNSYTGIDNKSEWNFTTKPAPAPIPQRLINVIGTLMDQDGNPLSGYTIEWHSDPVIVITDEAGKYVFNNVTITNHTLIIKNTAGTTLKTFAVSIEVSDDFSWNQPDGDSVQITLQDDTASIDVTINIPQDGDVTVDKIKNIINPKTGDFGPHKTNWVWIAVILSVLIVIAGLAMLKRSWKTA